MKKYNYLKDASFLKQIDNLQYKEQYVQITILDFKENPVQEIQGRVTSGSVSLNGDSSIRRTCNLTLLATENDIGYENADNLISINKKVNIEIGIKNSLKKYKTYGDIIWFPLGVYVINSKNISHTLEGINITLSLKDKMCLLNGESGGTLPAAIDFHKIENIAPDGKIYITQPTIYQIIQELVNHYGGEQLGKIIINDIDTKAKKIMKWNNASSLYQYINNEGKISVTTDKKSIPKDIFDNNAYTEYSKGENVGYTYTDFIYPEELTSNIGDTVVSILDKIKNTLGNFEYYYDIYGNFVFQEIKNYLNSSKIKIDLQNLSKDRYSIDISSGKSVYVFDTSNLITSYTNAPKYSTIKNDYIVWGQKKTSTNSKISIRYHLAIDKKPRVGENSYDCYIYIQNNIKRAVIPNRIDNLTNGGIVGAAYFKQTNVNNDLIGDIYICKANTGKESDFGEPIGKNLIRITPTDWRTELYFQGLQAQSLGIDAGYYFPELDAEWVKIYDIEKGEFYKEFIQNPSDINFFLDFIDTDAAVGEFSIDNIGRRSKVTNDDDVNCLFEPDFPDIILLNGNDPNITQMQEECNSKGQQWVLLPESIYNTLITGARYKGAYNEIRNQLYETTSYNESITVQSIPIFYLEPNTRITVVDPASGIGGDYIIKNISLPLAVNGTMSLSCTRALQKI